MVFCCLAGRAPEERSRRRGLTRLRARAGEGELSSLRRVRGRAGSQARPWFGGGGRGPRNAACLPRKRARFREGEGRPVGGAARSPSPLCRRVAAATGHLPDLPAARRARHPLAPAKGGADEEQTRPGRGRTRLPRGGEGTGCPHAGGHSNAAGTGPAHRRLYGRWGQGCSAGGRHFCIRFPAHRGAPGAGPEHADREGRFPRT